MIYEQKQTEKAAVLFQGWQETIIWSCLQGIMGKIYVDSLEHPASAMAILGDFCFLAGKPAKELLCCDSVQEWRDFMILVPQDTGWADFIENYYGEQANKVTRYAIRKEPDVFDRKKLQTAIDGLPDGYILKRMDETLFWQCRDIEWCRDWVLQYDDYSMYQKYGLGAVVLKDNEPVSGASSYCGYIGGIEVEIDTRKDFRRKSLAHICGAKLILECLKRGWYPSWDAQNPWSAALAEKLGYHFDYEYTVYEIFCKKVRGRS